MRIRSSRKKLSARRAPRRRLLTASRTSFWQYYHFFWRQRLSLFRAPWITFYEEPVARARMARQMQIVGADYSDDLILFMLREGRDPIISLDIWQPIPPSRLLAYLWQFQ